MSGPPLMVVSFPDPQLGSGNETTAMAAVHRTLMGIYTQRK